MERILVDRRQSGRKRVDALMGCEHRDQGVCIVSDVDIAPHGVLLRFHMNLEGVLNLCRKMSAEQDLPALLKLVAQEAAGLMEAERVTIFLLDKERWELRSQVTLDGEVIRFDARLGIAGAAAMTGQLVNVLDARQDERFYPTVDAQTNFRTRSVLALPLRTSSGDILGTFQALNKKGGPFRAADEEIAQTLAAQAAIAIDNAATVQLLKEQHNQLQAENTHLLREVESRFSTQNIIGTSERIQAIVRLIDQVRDSAVDVLITGESGTGKELVAKALHYNSPRARQPFVALNCAALPENLVESELFGIERGVATGVEKRTGKFEEAQGGTLFLDEIGDLSLPTQAKLLRILQERELTRVGGRTTIRVDVRIITATNVDVERAITKGTFRPDLYYRLRVVTIHTPALREIPEDIPLLTDHLLQKLCRLMEKDPKRLTPGALRSLSDYRWPGNVRELENELRRLVVSTRRTSIGREDLSEGIRLGGKSSESPPALSGRNLRDAVEELEVRLISDALRRSGGNQLQAAKALGLSRQGLIKKVKRYRLKTASP